MRSKPHRKADRAIDSEPGVFIFLFFPFVVRANPERSRFPVREAGQVAWLESPQHYRECQVVAVAAFVARLEGVTVGGYQRPVGKIREGACDRRCGGVVDDRKDRASR